MLTYSIFTLAALYLGVLTSISPCPLATNIAAISYIGSKVENSRSVIHAGVLYTIGRCLLYMTLAGLLTWTSLSIPMVSVLLQTYMHQLLGPILLLLGMLLAGVVSISFGSGLLSDAMQRRVDSMGLWGALLLGALFAMSFCPTSAAWFFGLLALTLGSDSGAIISVLTRIGLDLPSGTIPGGFVVLPFVYGIGTGLPVILVAFLLAFSASAVGATYKVLGKVEWWARMATGWIFISLGVYFSLVYVFDISTK